MSIFNDENIKIIEDQYDASYINDFGLERGSLDFTITGAVFYVENPDVSKGHSNYFAIYRDPMTSRSTAYLIALKSCGVHNG